MEQLLEQHRELKNQLAGEIMAKEELKKKMFDIRYLANTELVDSQISLLEARAEFADSIIKLGEEFLKINK